MKKPKTRTTERYHTSDEHDLRGLEPFLEHVRGYLAGTRTVPVSKTTPLENFPGVFFTFSDKLLKIFNKNPRKLRKPYSAAIKYGFRGHSRREKNGILFQRSKDKRMIAATTRLTQSHRSEISQDLCLEYLTDLEKVKIVWHNPSGERIVGVYNTQNNRISFLDYASY